MNAGSEQADARRVLASARGALWKAHARRGVRSAVITAGVFAFLAVIAGLLMLAGVNPG